MMKKLIISLAPILFFLLTGFVYPQKTFFKWKKFDAPQLSKSYIVSGKSLEDFWVFDLTGGLFHFKEDKWRNFPLKLKENLSLFRIEQTGNNAFILTGIDSDWRTHIYHFKNGLWKKDSLIIKNPITQILVLNSNDIYLSGDWAEFYHYNGRKWMKINTPFKNHVNNIVEKNGIIWIGVRSEGVFSYNGNSFKKYKIENDLITDNYIHIGKEGEIYFVTANRNIYFKKGDKFVKRKNTGKRSPPPLGYEFVDVNGDSVLVPLRLKRNVIKRLKNGSILIASENNFIYYAERSENNFFEDLSLSFKVEGHIDSKSDGAAFIYLNDDILPDLFVFNRAEEYPELYENKLNRPFVESSGKIESLLPEKSYLFTAGDLNGDLLTDFAFVSFESEGNTIRTFFRKSNDGFVKGKKIPSPEGYSVKPFGNIQLIDFNKNGKLDIDASTFFGEGMKKGNQLLLMNKGVEGPSEYDESFTALTKGWTAQSIFADFNNDGENDWLLITEWEAPKLLVRANESFELISLPVNDSAATLGALAFDYDNDGDLDLLTSSDEKIISVFNNDGRGSFSDATKLLNLEYFNSKPNSTHLVRNFSCGDFNNDGYLDIFLSLAESGKNRNYLFMNDSGKTFTEASGKYSIAYPYVNGAIVGDIDADGDLDIYGFREGFNALWTNNLNDKNYLEIIPRGIKSNYDGISAKVSVYLAGKDFDKSAIVGYRQIGASTFGKNKIDQRMAHFGVSSDKQYDVKVEFYGGETVRLINVSAGQIIEVYELTGLSSVFYLLPGKILRFVSSTENQIYILIVFVAFFILTVGIRFGLKRYRWSSATTIAIILVNISIFWVMIFLSLDSNSFFAKYALPLIVISFGLLLPHFIFYTMSKYSFSGKSKAEVEETLLLKLLLFSHGEWALRNLSGLQLLIENAPDKDNLSDFFELLEKRKKTFNEMTVPLMNEIIEALNFLGVEKKNAADIKKEIGFVQNVLAKTDKEKMNADELKNARASFASIKNAMKEIKEKIFLSFSCDPVEVVKSVSNEYVDLAKEKNIDFKKYRTDDGNLKALIKAGDLGIAIDNCLQNSFRAVEKTENPSVKIVVKKNAPKIEIEISDNGKGIDQLIREKIFEQGFSGGGGTGSGLFITKNILQKYNGRIYVKESKPGQGTVIAIELNEGI